MTTSEFEPKWPSGEELQTLPRWALVAYACRCARRLHHPSKPPSAILLAEKSAANGAPEDIAQAIRAAEIQADKDFNEVSMAGDATDWAVEDAAPSVAAAFAAKAVKPNGRGLYCTQRVIAELRYVHTWSKEVNAAVWRDYEILRDASDAESWDDSTPISSDFFALHSEFNLEDVQHFDEEVRAEIDARFLEYFARHPERLYSLTPHQFEEFVGELLEEFNYYVELTQRTRDGGRDIIAISNEPVGIKLLVECKRYARDRTVGIAPVQRLHGVCRADRATKGILVTTAHRFTNPAERFLREQEWLVEGRAFSGLLEWLKMYQRFQIGELQLQRRGLR